MSIEEINKVYECCKNSFRRHCDSCPVTDDCCHDKMPLFVLRHALELLNEQQKQLEEYHKADTFLEAHGWKWEG